MNTTDRALIKTIWTQPDVIVEWHVDGRYFDVIGVPNVSLVGRFEYTTENECKVARTRAVRAAKEFALGI